MATTTSTSRLPEWWVCGCATDGETYGCDDSCRVNNDWDLFWARDQSQATGGTIALLSSVLVQYEFLWTGDRIIGNWRPRYMPLQNLFNNDGYAMTLERMREDLHRPNTSFSHALSEHAALVEAVHKLQVLEDSHTAQLAQNLQLLTLQSMVDYNQYTWNIRPWQEWQPGKAIAALSGPAFGRPLVMDDSFKQRVILYEFRLDSENTIIATATNIDVRMAWRASAKKFKLHSYEPSAFKLMDVGCFLQTEPKLPISPEESTALGSCVDEIMKSAIQRLECPAFAKLRNSCPILRCEMHTYILCLRLKDTEQSNVRFQVDLVQEFHDWEYGHLLQLMPAPSHMTLEVAIVYGSEDEDKQRVFKLDVRSMSELNRAGVYFCHEGLGHAGTIFKPAAAHDPCGPELDITVAGKPLKVEKSLDDDTGEYPFDDDMGEIPSDEE